MRGIITYLTLLLCIAEINAQQCHINGTARDCCDFEPLIGATIQLVSSDTTIGTATDIDGHFQFENVNPGNYKLSFSFVGYEKRVMNLGYVCRDTTVNFDIYGDGRDLHTLAEEDIESGSPRLYTFGGIAPIGYSKSDEDFEKRYSIKYEMFGCVLTLSVEYMTAYNLRIFEWLTSKYGTLWLKKVHPDVLGLNYYKRRLE